MKLRGGALGLAISLAAAGFVAGCGSSNNSGAGGTGAGGKATGGTTGTGGKATGGTTGTGGKATGGTTGTGGSGTGGTAGSGAGGKTDAGTDAPADAIADAGTDVPKPTCGPFADGGMQSDAAVDAAANASFFVSSTGNPNANLGGPAAADAKCQSLAVAVGLGGKTWHAYLSVEHDPSVDGGAGAPINAKDRIGAGPWFNVKGVMVATSVSTLHMRNGDPAVFIDEHGAMIDGQWTGSTPPPKHDVLTGTNIDGTLAVGKTCLDWTSAGVAPDAGTADGGTPDGGELFVARVGHTNGFGPNCSQATTPNNLPSWNSAHDTVSCADIMSRGGVGHIYCFAIN